MGVAAYNRGSRSNARQLGTYKDPVKPRPQPRPAGWGDKALARATERAGRILRGNRRFGRALSREMLAACVVDKERVSQETAQRAADDALANEAQP